MRSVANDNLGRNRNFSPGKFFSLLFVCFFAAASFAFADATLFVSPITGNYLHGSEMRVAVMLSSADMPVNAAEGTLEYDPKEFRLERVDTSRSAIVSWTKMPAAGDPPGSISFAGAFASGRIVDRETLFEIFLTPLRSGELRLRWGSGAAIHAADGTGGNIVSALSGGVYLVEPKNSVPDIPEDPSGAAEETIATSSETGEVLGAEDVAAFAPPQPNDSNGTTAPAPLSPQGEGVAEDPLMRATNATTLTNEKSVSLVEAAKRHPIIPIGGTVLIALFAATVYFWKTSFREHQAGTCGHAQSATSKDPFRVSLKK